MTVRTLTTVRPSRLALVILLLAAATMVATQGVPTSSVHRSPPGLSPSSGAAALSVLTAPAKPQGHPLSFGPVTENGSSLPGWANLTGTTGSTPPYRSYGRSFAFDPVDNYLLMFGGYVGSYLADTWAFHAGKWTQLHPHTSPPGRDHSTLAWDPIDGYLVLFGGSNSGGDLSDTWTFLHGNWTELAPTSHPSARWASSMAWDSADQEILLFGGCAGGAIGDTWTFVNGNWTQLHPSPSPSARENPSLVSDPADNTTVLFGGDDYGSNYDGDTWTFNAGNWTENTAIVHPTARSEASAAFDPTIPAVVIYGGAGTYSYNLGDTWWFSAGRWTEQSSIASPPGRLFGEMADDPVDSVLVLFSGSGASSLDDTWEYYGLNLTASITANGGAAPLTVNVTASEAGGLAPFTYAWDLGNGQVVDNATAGVVYTTAGMYFPSATVMDANGASAVAHFSVDVIIPLELTALASPVNGTAPLSVQFSSIATGGTAPYTYSWSSGVGSPSSLASPTFVYPAAGVFVATVTVTDTVGASQDHSFTIHVIAPTVVPLSVVATASTVSGPAPLSVWFASNVAGGFAPYTLRWNFGDGTLSTQPTVQHTFNASGSIGVTLLAVDARGTQHVAFVNLTVTTGLWAEALAEPLTARATTNVTFLGSVGGGTGPYFEAWNFGDGLGSAQLNTTHAYQNAGTYTATLTVVDSNGRTSAQSVTLTIGPGPTRSLPPPPSTPTTSAGSGTVSAEWIAVGTVVGAVVIAAAVILSRPRR
ncbi:MAG: PKD domain-containing protein [Thermoplasmata archaeon]|nr:PKD domain-containing protein [Thermoplasmata archaeon]